MKLKHLLTGTLLLTLLLTPPANAQSQPTIEQILQACAYQQTQTLPMPFTDIPDNHWAREAVINMYYCGGVRGPIAEAELRRVQQQTSVNIKTLLSAPTTLKIDNRQYNLETYLWRDFMPMTPPDGTPLIASLRLSAADGKIVPNSLNANRIWLIENGQILWETNLADENRQPPSNQIKRIARNGPNLQPGTAVDIVVQVTDNKNQTYFIKASKQIIQRTD
ncbi:hypothetical protein NG798_21250 [Ancylothrix sp. C2]|uniref:hypothetical protein n=1 Tax=Ancylothrix sp. D3o TaxID=2953691 RepID=UPI0021BB63F1|nr:hypothetical protein [Ancylothrix sp. D3o]MCT7952326.1 hypothetical protein [Ancylothrix sp. D3o]